MGAKEEAQRAFKMNVCVPQSMATHNQSSVIPGKRQVPSVPRITCAISNVETNKIKKKTRSQEYIEVGVSKGAREYQAEV